MFMFTPLKIITNETNTVIWEEFSPASPNSCRILSLLLGKETDVCLKDLYKVITNKRIAIQSSPIKCFHNNREYNVKIILKMSMIDGKMRSLLSGLGGAYCMLCKCVRNDAVNIDSSFTMNRTGVEVTEVWNKLCSGELVKKPHDQDVRLGVTREPLVELEAIALISPMHAGCRVFETLLKLIYHLNGRIFNWSDEKKVLGDDYSILQASKNTVRALIKEKTHISVDIPDSTGKGGTSTTGNVVHALLSEEKNIQVLVSAVPKEFQESLHECLTRCYVIMKLYNSNLLINVDAYNYFCSETKKLLLTAFNHDGKQWIFLTPTAHSLFDHSGELIEANGSRGLSAYTESSLECNNKVLRLISFALSRKTNQIDNLNDCINRMWIRSDIHIRKAIPDRRYSKRSESSSNTRFRFQGQMPLVSLADYYIKDLVVE